MIDDIHSLPLIAKIAILYLLSIPITYGMGMFTLDNNKINHLLLNIFTGQIVVGFVALVVFVVWAMF